MVGGLLKSSKSSSRFPGCAGSELWAVRAPFLVYLAHIKLNWGEKITAQPPMQVSLNLQPLLGCGNLWGRGRVCDACAIDAANVRHSFKT